MLKVFEAFAGIGSQTQALKNIGVEHEVVAISEIDKWAIASYEAIHGKVKNLGDITKLKDEDIPEHDLFTYSFPCQDISLAGKQRGLDKNSNTRSSLLWDCERVIRVAHPKYLLLENVKNLVGRKHKHNFDEWLETLEGYGYKNYWQVLNAKDYGIPQNRERVFVVSIRDDINTEYTFPKPKELNCCLKNFLEEKVDEKYYLNEEIQSRFVFKPIGENVVGTSSPKAKIGQRGLVYNPEKIIGCLTATDYKDPKKTIEYYTKKHRIRKLTPKECWRLMGFKDEQFDKAQQVCSNTQLYKQAGNSIVVNVLEEIFKQMFFNNNEELKNYYTNYLRETDVIRNEILCNL